EGLASGRISERDLPDLAIPAGTARRLRPCSRKVALRASKHESSVDDAICADDIAQIIFGLISVRLTSALSSFADGGIEACSGRGIVLEAGEVEPPEVAVEVFCGAAAMGAQEGFEALVATVDGLDV